MRNKIWRWIGVTNGKPPWPTVEQRIVAMKMWTSCSIPVLLDITTSEYFASVLPSNCLTLALFSQSTPESWAQSCHDNIVNGQNQLMASIQLRSLIDSILTDISRDMREQADVVESEFARRIAEMSDSMQKMIQNLREVRNLSFIEG